MSLKKLSQITNFLHFLLLVKQNINTLFTRVLRIFFSRNFSAAMNYQMGFSAFLGDSRVKEEGWEY